MNKPKQYPKQLAVACFSPLVMFLTFSFELIAAAWIILRYKFDRKASLIVAILVFLAAFQVAEYQVCAEASSQIWARFGFIATAVLIPLGTSLINALSKDSWGVRLERILWALGAAFIAWFLLVPSSVVFVWCGGNYSLYRLQPILGVLYTTFYFVSLTLMLVQINRRMHTRLSAATAKGLMGVGLGLSSFIIPTLAVNIIDPTTLRAIPSILCGFAVIFAMFLVGVVAPAVLHPRKR